MRDNILRELAVRLEDDLPRSSFGSRESARTRIWNQREMQSVKNTEAANNGLRHYSSAYNLPPKTVIPQRIRQGGGRKFVGFGADR